MAGVLPCHAGFHPVAPSGYLEGLTNGQLHHSALPGSGGPLALGIHGRGSEYAGEG